MSIFDKINSLYKNYSTKEIKVKASDSFVNFNTDQETKKTTTPKSTVATINKSGYSSIPTKEELKSISSISKEENKKETMPIFMDDKKATDAEYFKIGNEYLKQKKFDFAAQAFKQILENKPQNSKVRGQLGLAYIGMEEYQKAIEELKEALITEKSNTELKLNLATAHIKTDKPDIAIKDLLQLSKLHPTDDKIKKKLSNAYYVLANKFKKKDDNDSAIDSYNKALKYDKTNPTITYAIALAYKDKQDIGLAFAYLINISFFITYLIFFIMSVFYSHPKTRWKSNPFISVATVGFGQGGLAFIGGWFTQSTYISNYGLFIFGVFTTIFMSMGVYPLTQLYQIEEDKSRNDITFAVYWGVKKSFIFSMICIFISGISILSVLYLQAKFHHLFIIGSFYTIFTIQILYWAKNFDEKNIMDNYDKIMTLNYSNALGFMIYILLSTFQLLP